MIVKKKCSSVYMAKRRNAVVCERTHAFVFRKRSVQNASKIILVHAYPYTYTGAVHVCMQCTLHVHSRVEKKKEKKTRSRLI